MSPTVAASAASSLHASTGGKTAQRGTPPSSQPSKVNNGKNLLAQWASSKPKQSQPQKSKSSAANSSAARNKVVPKTNKKKKPSPFRIKVGCIVALRYRSEGNHVTVLRPDGTERQVVASTAYSEVWADPMPGRDEGLALLGKRIRCCFPKSVLSEKKGIPAASSRILEGEIVSLVDYETQWRVQRKRRRQRDPCGIAVELLIDRASLSSMPFLKRTDEAVNAENMSEKEKKRHRYEEIIRGKYKVPVQVTLADTARISKARDKKSKESNDDTVARWVIRKRVSLPLGSSENKTKNGGNHNENTNGDAAHDNKRSIDTVEEERPQKRRKVDGKKSVSMTRYIGDGNDSPEQQERNWRWILGRYDDWRLWEGESSLRISPSDEISAGLVGEVLQMTPTTMASSSSTLATVTLRRIVLPEQTKMGRMSDHGPFDLFDDYDSSVDMCKDGTQAKISESAQRSNGENFYRFRVPVEELVIICRRFQRPNDTSSSLVAEKPGVVPSILASYSFEDDTFRPRFTCREGTAEREEKCEGNVPTLDVCHRCRRTTPSSEMKAFPASCSTNTDTSEGDSFQRAFCSHCVSSFEFQNVGDNLNVGSSCSYGHCDCRCCLERVGSGYKQSFARNNRDVANDTNGYGEKSSEQFCNASSMIRATQRVDFCVPKALLELSSLPIPSEKPVSKVRKPKLRGRVVGNQKSVGKISALNRRSDKVKTPAEIKSKKPNQPVDMAKVQRYEEEPSFEPSCSRLLPYDPKSKTFSGVPKQQVTRKANEELATGTAERHKETARGGTTRENVRGRGKPPEKKMTSRAARANQRRMMKDVAAFGHGLDTLAGREQMLRFDKSLIHAWGVFADEEINTGEMIVEYRGELIGNTVAEKREKEYERAKIGSDYMFRIDAHTVCDATKQGNVARFINASCSPNCYTQIITLNGVKRIVIYAKRDIQAGEELCYDYKFPLEYDETKRIKCYCGATECRGFMNWDKKYVAITTRPGIDPAPSIDGQAV